MASAMRASGDLRTQTHSYDHRGRLAEVVTEDAIGVRATATYAYAEPGWLTDEVIVDGAGSRSTTYGHDAAGNRTSAAVTVGGVTTTRTFGYAYGNRLTSVDGAAVGWNAFGETTTDHRGADIDRAADGAEVGLSSVTGTALYAFTRGPGGEAVEVEEAVSGDVRSFLWGAGEADVPVSVLDGAGDDQATIAVEGLVVGRLDSGSFVAMAPDGRGGVLLDGSEFLGGAGAFGEGAGLAAGSSERRVWAMLESLPGTAYSLPRRRLYDAETGRFASQDPIGLAGGDHRFMYVDGNPNGGVDPSGLVAYSAEPYAGGAGMGQRDHAVLGAYGNSAGWAATRGASSGSPGWMGREAFDVMGSFGGTAPGCGNDPDCWQDTEETPEETEEAKEEVDVFKDDEESFLDDPEVAAAFAECRVAGCDVGEADEELDEDTKKDPAFTFSLTGDADGYVGPLADDGPGLSPFDGDADDWIANRDSPADQTAGQDFARLDSLRIGRDKGLVNGFVTAVPDSTVGLAVTFTYLADPDRGAAGLEAYSDWRSANLPMPYENEDEAEGGGEGETLAQVMVAIVEAGAGAVAAPASLADDAARGARAVTRVRNREAELALEAVPEVVESSGRGIRPTAWRLGRALEAAGHVRPPGSAAHHIVAANAPAAARARAVLARFGIDLDDAANGVFLPANLNAPNPGGAAVHSTLHTAGYYQDVNQMLLGATTRAEAVAALDAIRTGLLSGGL